MRYIADWKQGKILEKGKRSFIDDEIKLSTVKLAPTIYSSQINWKEAEL